MTLQTDISGWSIRLDSAVAARYRASGAWRGMTLADCAREQVARAPNKVAVVDGAAQLSFSQLYAQGLRLAAALRARGLAPGEVISFQLPNWHEALVINLAASIGGFVCNPIIPIYRDAEVGFILARSRTRVFFIPERFRSMDYLAMVARLRPALPHLKDVVLVRSTDDSAMRYEPWVAEPAASETHGSAPFPPVSPDAVKLLLYTSGTTGDPKGVLHTHNTLCAEIDAVRRFWRVSSDDAVLMPSPVTHITGYLYAMELPFAAGLTAVLMDRWEAEQGALLIARHGVTFSVGATPFLVELVEVVERRAMHLPSLRLYVSGGAPVPPEIVKRAHLVLPNCQTFRVYGSTEAPSISLGVQAGDPPELGATTDGRIVNHEVRIIDPVSGEPVPIGTEGEIVTRGPEVMLGYTDPAYTQEAFDEDGFFHTGDLGFVDARGYITISGRKKDLIIRGGENISPKEIEDVLHRHPAILEAAVVATPHPRMGETPCAYVVLRPGHTLDFDAMKAFLDSARLARQKIPEKLMIVPELPHTASGKILKHVLRANEAQAGRA